MYIVSGDDVVTSEATSKYRLSPLDDDAATMGNNEAQEVVAHEENNQQVVLVVKFVYFKNLSISLVFTAPSKLRFYLHRSY